LISRHQHRFAVELGVAVVEPQHMQPNIPKGSKKAGLGSSRLTAGQRAVNGHGLRRVFDSARSSQAPMRAQRMIGQAMGAAAAADMPRVPLHDLIEQAHAAMMGNVFFDPATV